MNVYQMVTDRIIHELEQGIIPWNKPWTGIKGGAFNRISRKPYSLINQMMLRHQGEYASYKQWQSCGGQVRKGENAEQVVFWKIMQKKGGEGRRGSCHHDPGAEILQRVSYLAGGRR